MDSSFSSSVVHPDHHYHPAASAVSWSAILAGATAAAALSFILLLLGLGLGFSVVSPWDQAGPSAKSLSIASLVWLIVTSILASGLGGYLAGRLRRRWPNTDPDEVHFRDTAHGLLSWALATLLTACLLTSGISRLLSHTAAVATPAANLAASLPTDQLMIYQFDAVLRPIPGHISANADTTAPTAAASTARAELLGIWLKALATDQLTSDDRQYLTQRIAEQTGLSQADAEQRLNQRFTEAQQAKQQALVTADQARKAVVHTLLWLFIALLSSAFTASLLAIYGGRQRDL